VLQKEAIGGVRNRAVQGRWFGLGAGAPAAFLLVEFDVEVSNQICEAPIGHLAAPRFQRSSRAQSAVDTVDRKGTPALVGSYFAAARAEILAGLEVQSKMVKFAFSFHGVTLPQDQQNQWINSDRECIA